MTVLVGACHITNFPDANVSIEREHARGHLSFFAHDPVKGASIPFGIKFNSGMCVTTYSDVYTIILGEENIERHDA